MPEPKSRTNFLLTVGMGCLTILMMIAILVFASSNDRSVAIRTIMLGLAASTVAIPIGSLITWVCLGTGFVSRLMRIAVLALLLIPLFIQVSGWDAAFGKLGWLTATRGQVLTPLVSGWTAAVWIHGVAAAPQVALILLIGISMGKRVFEEQALLDTSRSGVFWNVTSQRLLPLILLSVLWIIVTCAREIAVTDLYQIGTLAEQIYLGYSLGLNSTAGTWTPQQILDAGSIGPGFTTFLITCLVGMALVLFFRFTDLEYESSAMWPTQSLPPSKKRAIVGCGLMGVLVAIPMGNVILRACFFVRPINGVPTQGYSASQLFRAIRRSCFDYQDEFVWSFLIAFTSATMIILAGMAFASFARNSRAIQILFAVSLAVCCAIPGPMIGSAISGLLSASSNETVHWLANYTIFGPVLANLIFCWPLGSLVVWFVFRKIPQDVLESSSVEGAGGIYRFFHFGLGQNILAIAGCWIISFAFCFGELSASQIVRPAGIDTVPRKMLGDLHAGVDELTAGITIVMTSLIVVISWSGWGLIRLNQYKNGRK